MLPPLTTTLPAPSAPRFAPPPAPDAPTWRVPSLSTRLPLKELLLVRINRPVPFLVRGWVAPEMTPGTVRLVPAATSNVPPPAPSARARPVLSATVPVLTSVAPLRGRLPPPRLVSAPMLIRTLLATRLVKVLAPPSTSALAGLLAPTVRLLVPRLALLMVAVKAALELSWTTPSPTLVNEPPVTVPAPVKSSAPLRLVSRPALRSTVPPVMRRALSAAPTPAPSVSPPVVTLLLLSTPEIVALEG